MEKDSSRDIVLDKDIEKERNIFDYMIDGDPDAAVSFLQELYGTRKPRRYKRTSMEKRRGY